MEVSTCMSARLSAFSHIVRISALYKLNPFLEAQSRGNDGGGGGEHGGRSGGYRSGGGGGCGGDGGRREYGYNGGGWWRWLSNLHPQNLEHKTSSTRSSSTKP
ncbi:hypothetical protein Bca4012_093195 [Brassica carinata]